MPVLDRLRRKRPASPTVPIAASAAMETPELQYPKPEPSDEDRVLEGVKKTFTGFDPLRPRGIGTVGATPLEPKPISKPPPSVPTAPNPHLFPMTTGTGWVALNADWVAFGGTDRPRVLLRDLERSDPAAFEEIKKMLREHGVGG